LLYAINPLGNPVLDITILLVAGLVSGIINAIAGGGSLISFPALVFVGVPPLFANATNTYASCAGYLSGCYAFRKSLANHKKQVLIYCLLGLVGGTTGGLLLLQIDVAQFDAFVPWLVLFATLLFIFGERINTLLKSEKTTSTPIYILGLLSFLLVCVYGGFFNAGLGIILLSTLAIAGYSNINLMNGLKLLVSAIVSIFALVVFIYNDMIAWYLGSILLFGNILGSYFAAVVSQRLSKTLVRNFVIVMSVLMTIYFFSITYG
ncbi:MAG: sulfite exporter TauE/SafE family protein, partial [Glaciecola sp.]